MKLLIYWNHLKSIIKTGLRKKTVFSILGVSVTTPILLFVFQNCAPAKLAVDSSSSSLSVEVPEGSIETLMAQGGGRYQKKLISKNQLSSLVVQGQSITKNFENSADLNTITSSGTQLLNTMRSELNNYAQREMPGAQVNVQGPITLEMNGNSNIQDVEVSLGLKQIKISISKTEQAVQGWLWSWTTVTCNVHVSMNEPKFLGTFNLLAGDMELRADLQNVQQSSSCSSGIGWVPFIGNFIDGKINALVADQLAAAIKNGVSSLKTKFVAHEFFGLNEAVKENQFVAGGFDYGKYLKENLIGLIQNNRVIVSLAERTSSMENEQSDELFSINFLTTNAKYSMVEERVYEMIYVCNRGRNCIEP